MGFFLGGEKRLDFEVESFFGDGWEGCVVDEFCLFFNLGLRLGLGLGCRGGGCRGGCRWFGEGLWGGAGTGVSNRVGRGERRV